MSPGFLTEVNFPAPIRNPGSGDFGVFELIGDPGDTSIWLRPKEAFTSTDLWVPMEDGKTAVFYVTYDDETNISRRYVPADTVTEREVLDRRQITSLEETHVLPSWVHFNYDATVQGDDLFIAYSLKNNGLHPLVNDSTRLRVLANGHALEYKLAAKNRKNRLMSGEGEDGTLLIENLPPSVSDIALEWVLVAQGIGTLYRIYEPVVLQ